jgi:hypothetical protein
MATLPRMNSRTVYQTRSRDDVPLGVGKRVSESVPVRAAALLEEASNGDQ